MPQKKCILELVNKFTTDKVAEAFQVARKNVYRTDANYAHSELRHLLHFGTNGISEVCAYFDNMKKCLQLPIHLQKLR